MRCNLRNQILGIQDDFIVGKANKTNSAIQKDYPIILNEYKNIENKEIICEIRVTYNLGTSEIIKIGQKERCNLIVIHSEHSLAEEVAKKAYSKVLVTKNSITKMEDGITKLEILYSDKANKTSYIFKTRLEFYNRLLNNKNFEIVTKQLEKYIDGPLSESEKYLVVLHEEYLEKYVIYKNNNIFIDRYYTSGRIGRVNIWRSKKI